MERQFQQDEEQSPMPPSVPMLGVGSNAAGVIDEGGAGRVQTLMAELKVITRRRFCWMSAIGFGGELTCFVLFLCGIRSMPIGRAACVLMTLDAIAAFVLATWSCFLLLPSKRQRAIRDVLAQCEDARAIGPLLTWFGTWRDYETTTTTGLVRLLGRVRGSDADCLSQGNLRALRRLLGPFGRALHPEVQEQLWTDLLVASLSAIGEVGDTRALKRVTRIADRPAKASPEQRIRDAARACRLRLQVGRK
jgi:hypothetical protein